MRIVITYYVFFCFLLSLATAAKCPLRSWTGVGMHKKRISFSVIILKANTVREERKTLNPLLLDFPTEFYTERLLIRMPKPGDGKAVYDAIQASMNDLKPWMPFVQKEPSEQDAEANTNLSTKQG